MAQKAQASGLKIAKDFTTAQVAQKSVVGFLMNGLFFTTAQVAQKFK